MILRAFWLALAQMGDPRFWGVALRALGLTAGLFLAVALAAILGLGLVLPDRVVLPFLGEVGWLDALAQGALGVSLLVASVFLMIPVAAMVTGLFLDSVVEAVEQRHYPALLPTRPVPLIDGIIDGVNFLGVMIAVNLLALIPYLLAGPFAPLVFYLVNGFLLGREYFTQVALRRSGRGGARRGRRRHWAVIWTAGTLMAVPLTIPVMNLIVPILGVAVFTHLYQQLEGFDRRPWG